MTCSRAPSAGLMILNAHRVTDNSGEGFAVRLYRQGSGLGVSTGQGSAAGNDQGFVRAFSDNPNAFAAGFNRCVVSDENTKHELFSNVPIRSATSLLT